MRICSQVLCRKEFFVLQQSICFFSHISSPFRMVYRAFASTTHRHCSALAPSNVSKKQICVHKSTCSINRAYTNELILTYISLFYPHHCSALAPGNVFKKQIVCINQLAVSIELYISLFYPRHCSALAPSNVFKKQIVCINQLAVSIELYISLFYPRHCSALAPSNIYYCGK